VNLRKNGGRKKNLLTADQLDALVVPIVRLYSEYEDRIIADIARRIGNMNFASASWQVQRLSESGFLYQDILKKLSVLTGKSDQELRNIFKRGGVRTLNFDDSVYRQAGMSPIPLNLSPAMLNVLKIGIEKTSGALRNLTMTTAIESQNAFINATDQAYLAVSSGALDYNTAIRRAVKSVGESGLMVVYPSGARSALDVATRRAVLTGVGQTAGRLQWQRADEMGVDLVQVSAHVGARNTGEGYANHESWQGKIYSRSGLHQKYKHFETETGYGTGEGLHGYNCRHSFYPFFEGISKDAYDKATRDEAQNKTVTYNGKQISAYEASQIQRAYERRVRYFKRQQLALEAAKLDAARETAKIKAWQARLRDLIKQTGRNREYVREQI
jgi:hypothetical protein